MRRPSAGGSDPGRLRSEKVGTQHLVREEDLLSLVDDAPIALPAAWTTTETGAMPPVGAPRARRARRALSAMRLVLDSSAALRACKSAGARADLDDAGAAGVLATLAALGVARRAAPRLHAEAHRVATELGWAKTYDAEFIALARLERAVVLTTDKRLRRGADRTGLVIDPNDLRSMDKTLAR